MTVPVAGSPAEAHHRHHAQAERVRVVEIAARLGAVPPIGQKLYLAWGAWLETHQQPAGDRITACRAPGTLMRISPSTAGTSCCQPHHTIV
jgi:hypothetical protein